MCCWGTLRHPTTHTTQFSSSLLPQQSNTLLLSPTGLLLLLTILQFLGKLLRVILIVIVFQYLNILFAVTSLRTVHWRALRSYPDRAWAIYILIVLHLLNVIFTVMVVVPVPTPTHPGAHLRATHRRALRSYPGRAWVPPTKTSTTPLPVWRARGMRIPDRWRALRSYLCPVSSALRVLLLPCPWLLRRLRRSWLLRRHRRPWLLRRHRRPAKLLRVISTLHLPGG